VVYLQWNQRCWIQMLRLHTSRTGNLSKPIAT
jgi:hypothetical protein